MKNLLLFSLVLALALSLAQALSCDGNNGKCRGGTCIKSSCAVLSGTGGPCDDSGDCLFGNTCDTERGQCVVPCPGQTNCGTVDNKKCVTIATDSNNCGACSFSCGANAYCSNGKCQCNQYYGNCDNNYGTGCEVNLLTSNTYCGYCGTGYNCGARSACSSGTCACNSAAYGNCDGDYTNGCEVSLFSTNTCGTCGNLKNCGANTQCPSGTCACNANFGDCNGDLNSNGNGCESNLNTDDTFCGSCGAGNNCGGSGNADSTCNSGFCQCSSPGTNYNDNGTYTDGCESITAIQP